MPRLRDVHHLLEVVGLFAAFVAAGTAGFAVLEGLSALDALHLTLQTLTTVGYGTPVIQTAEGRVFSNLLMVFGVATVLYAFFLLMDLSVGDHVRRALGTRSYRRELRRMREHIIVCGYGRVGHAAVERLRKKDQDLVVICHEREALEDLPEAVPRIVGDATEEDVLREAGVEEAQAVLIAFGDDSDTVLAILTAKALNPGVRVIARASQRENSGKMLKVGADEVIVPELEGGRTMADHGVESPAA